MRKFAFTLWWIRASKLRFPDSTLAAMRSLRVIASSSPRSSGPELPMQVVQPNATDVEAQSIEVTAAARSSSGTR